MSLFEFPQQEHQPNKPQPGAPWSVSQSHVVSRQSKLPGSADVDYARLSDEEHQHLKDVVDTLKEYESAIRDVLGRSTRNWGRHKNANSTLGDMLDGVHAKLRKRHPHVQGREGQDCSIKQLKAVNDIIGGVNTKIDEPIPLIVIPAK